MGENVLRIESAHVNNLKNIDVEIPLNKLTVITGVSGSGKSSLAFDTIYEEGRRRYLMFSGLEAESNQEYREITGLSPTVALEQRIIRQTNVRSTVGSKSQIIYGLAYIYAKYGRTLEGRNDIGMGIEYFNKNTTKGMCRSCIGKGYIIKIDYEKMLQPYEKKISELFKNNIVRKKEYINQLNLFCKKNQITFDTTIDALSEDQREELLIGDSSIGFDGIVALFNDYTGNTVFSKGRKHSDIYEMYTNRCTCEKCNGYGLSKKALNTKIQGKHIGEVCDLTIPALKVFIQKISKEDSIIHGMLKKIEIIEEVGLSHLSLSRNVTTLSGGELQRLFLVSYLITNLQSLIFIFDEPTIGLHEIEKHNLMKSIYKLVKNKNTVIIVEHDKYFMECADYIIDIGPGAGENGGQVIFQGNYHDFLSCKRSNTACYLNGTRKIRIKNQNRAINSSKTLSLHNVSTHNLKSVSIDIPLNVMVGIAGVSGSGKSSLISDTLVPILKMKMKNKFVDLSLEEAEEQYENSDFDGTTLQGIENLTKCIIVDQKPIGRKSTSTPISYLGGFTRIRELLASTSYAVSHGYNEGLFSKNSNGRCQCCLGLGEIPVNIGLGNEIYIRCDECEGTGYVSEALEVKYKDKNIYDIMLMSFSEAAEFFKEDKKLSKLFDIMVSVGMGYMKLGQKTTTISGGEAQRIKLAKELSQSIQNCLFILDEPTTGLSFQDTDHLLDLLNTIVDYGNSMIIIEHDIAVLENCDYIVELGPGGGQTGGNIIAAGTVCEIRKNKNSLISKYFYK